MAILSISASQVARITGVSHSVKLTEILIQRKVFFCGVTTFRDERSHTVKIKNSKHTECHGVVHVNYIRGENAPLCILKVVSFSLWCWGWNTASLMLGHHESYPQPINSCLKFYYSVLMPLKTVNKYWGTVNRESQSTIF
jgi:hypothetical protein